jgi:hypothetical protein
MRCEELKLHDFVISTDNKGEFNEESHYEIVVMVSTDGTHISHDGKVKNYAQNKIKNYCYVTFYRFSDKRYYLDVYKEESRNKENQDMYILISRAQ